MIKKKEDNTKKKGKDRSEKGRTIGPKNSLNL